MERWVDTSGAKIANVRCWTRSAPACREALRPGAYKPSGRPRCQIQCSIPPLEALNMKCLRFVARIAVMMTFVALTARAQDYRGRGDSVFVWSARIRDGGMLTIKNVVGAINVTESNN